MKRTYPGPYESLSSAHSGLAWVFLLEPLASSIKLDSLAESLDFQLLTQAIQKNLSQLSTAASCDQALWLLAHYIYLFRRWVNLIILQRSFLQGGGTEHEVLIDLSENNQKRPQLRLFQI